MLNRREIDRQRVHIILHVNVRNVKKVMDDIVRAASHTHTLQLAVHEGLLYYLEKY